jgi:hypothetical protein
MAALTKSEAGTGQDSRSARAHWAVADGVRNGGYAASEEVAGPQLGYLPKA